MTALAERYRALLDERRLSHDPAQAALIEKLDALVRHAQRLPARDEAERFLAALGREARRAAARVSTFTARSAAARRC